MSYYYFTAAVSNALGTLANWDNADSDGNDLHSVASQLPGLGDIGFVDGTSGGVPVSGSTACTINLINGGSITGGTYNGSVNDIGGGAEIAGGTFNGDVSGSGTGFSGGVFNSNVYDFDGPSFYGCTFNGPVIVADCNQMSTVTFNDRLSLDGGTTFLYSPNSSAVAPASKVSKGTSNLGVAGTAPALLVNNGTGNFGN